MPTSHFLTPNEARRAIYIDLDGNFYRPSTLLGILYAFEHADGSSADFDVVEQWVLEPSFRGSVGVEPSVTGRANLASLVRKLIAQATREQRRIVSWDLNDFDLIMTALGTRKRATRAFTALYRYAEWTAEVWAQSWNNGERFWEHSLLRYMERIGYNVPADHAVHLTGDALGTIRKTLELRGRNWQKLTERDRTKFRAALTHSRHNLLGGRAVATHAMSFLYSRGKSDLLSLLKEVGLCTKTFCSTCGPVISKRQRLQEFVESGANVSDMLIEINARELDGEFINGKWLVELLHPLPTSQIGLILRTWAKAGVLRCLDLADYVVSDLHVMQQASPSVRRAILDALRERALEPSEWVGREILLEQFGREITADDPIRVAYANDPKIERARRATYAAHLARIAKDRARGAAREQRDRSDGAARFVAATAHFADATETQRCLGGASARAVASLIY